MTVEIEGFGKLTANKELLNWISILASKASEKFIYSEHFALAEDAEALASATYEALRAKGYYN